MASVAEDFRHRHNIELRQIRYFVTLAQELNFRRAAERLFITQPSLSRQIALLETTLGVRLFHRDRRRVSLTQAGMEILDDAQHMLAESQAIVMKAHRIALADSAILHVGYPEFANRTIIPDIFSVFRSRHPEVKLQLSEGYSRALLRDLRHGRLDVAFVMVPPAEDLGNLQVEGIIDEKSGLLLAANHRLAARSEIPLEAIAREQLLLVDRSVNPAAYDAIVDWFHESGLEPRFFNIGGSGVYTYDTALRVIQSGEAVSLSANAMVKDLPPGVVFRPICSASPHFQVAAVWPPSNPSPSLRQFLYVAREFHHADRETRRRQAS